MSEFPNNIYTPRETENLPGISYDENNKRTLYSEDFQNLGNEINAIQQFLGVQGFGVIKRKQTILNHSQILSLPEEWFEVLAPSDENKIIVPVRVSLAFKVFAPYTVGGELYLDYENEFIGLFASSQILNTSSPRIDILSQNLYNLDVLDLWGVSLALVVDGELSGGHANNQLYVDVTYYEVDVTGFE